MKLKHEPSIRYLRTHNRRMIHRYYDKHIANTLSAIRHDLMIQGCDPASRADQVSVAHQMMRLCLALMLKHGLPA